MAIKRLWKDQELIGLAETVDSLRRIRTAAAPSPTIRDRLGTLLRAGEKPAGSIDALSDAEQLADAAGEFFAAKISRTRGSASAYEAWISLLSDSKRRYAGYRPSTFARTMTTSVGGNIIDKLRALHIDPEYTVNLVMFTGNNFGANTLPELFAKQIGVFAPLSGDYLEAATIARYLLRTRGETFEVRAAGLSRNLSLGVLPVESSGDRVFSSKAEIGIFLDVVDTGRTGQALLSLLRERYPDKLLHEPAGNVEFEQSERMKKYWEQA